jgi:hypothetical protein
MSAGGDAEMRAVRLLASLVALGLRGFFVIVGRRGVWRLPVFFVAAAASDSGKGCFISSVVFVFFGTSVKWLNDFNSFIVHRVVRKCFLVFAMRSGKLKET